MRIWRRLSSFFQHKFRYMRLQTKFLLIILLSVFLPLATALLLLSRYYTEMSVIRSEDAMHSSFEQTYDIFADRFDSIQQNVSLLLLDDAARDLLQDRAYNHDMQEQRRIKESVMQTVDFIENSDESMQIRIYVPNDYTVVTDSQYIFSFQTIRQAEWFYQLRHNNYRNIWISSDLYAKDNTPITASSKLGNRPILSYAIRVNNPNDYSKIASVLRLDFALEHIEQMLDQAMQFDGSSVALIDQDFGGLVANATYGLESPILPPNLEGLRFSETIWQEREIDGEIYYVAARSFKDHPWALVMTVPQSSVYTVLDNSQWLTLILLAIICGILVFVICLMFSKQLTDRLGVVSSHMKAVRDGEMQAIESSKSKDEIGELTDSYNYMLYEIEMLIQSTYLSGITQREAELRALQSQINPHFLYNTLELINYYAFENNPQSVERIVSLLAKFYKLSLNRGQDLYHVWQELELTEIYFEIQNIRYEGRFTLELEVPQTLYQYEIPKITLQPLLENAIRHGILWRDDQRGVVRVIGEECDGIITFTIEDNGAGMTPEKLEALRRALIDPMQFESISPDENSGSHYGIRNVHERIQNYYGKEYGLRFESEVGVGTRVIITIPAV